MNDKLIPKDVARSDRRPLIVQVVRQYAPSRGGLEDVVANLCKAMPNLGYRVRVVTCDRLFTDPDTRLASRDIVDGVEVVRIPWHGSSRYPLAPAVFKHIRDADLVHVHAVDFFFDALAWSRFLHGRPMVATTHGGFFHTRRFSALKKIWFRTVTRISASAYRVLVCCSQSDLDLFNTIASGRTVLIENGVDSLKFAGDGPGQPGKRLVTIGRFSVNKRLDRLIGAMAALVARDPDWHLDIVGSASDLDGDDLRRMVAERGLGDHVSLHLSPDNAAIRLLLSQATLFVSASEYEGFGLVAVEAMGAGLVPVLHANDAYKALAAQHQGVMLTDFSDAVAASSAILQAFAHVCEQPEQASTAMRLAASGYSWDRVAARYASVYAEALGRGA